MDAVGAFNHCGVHLFGVSAAATGFISIRRQFSLHIPQDSLVEKNALIDGAKPFVVHIEPVEVPVEAQRDGGCFAGGHLFNHLQRGQIAVEPANDIESIG
ncbi:MAG: hypothetical protein ABS56_16450 [Lautropia sp. SCN 69-89]|nr:MAG: hypothetical protein ABS56_16450 [Lautropia sp. SCN 69-89]